MAMVQTDSRTYPGQIAPVAEPRQNAATYLVPVLIILAALFLAALLFHQYQDYARYRWSSVIHDRNAHYLLGLSLSMDVKTLNVPQLLSDLDGARTWPPLHGILEGMVLLVGGPDHRLAVLPSLAGWFGAMVLAFFVARRMVPAGGNLAGAVAALFVAVSPAHHAFATDTMLESLGAFWTLLALYLYLVAVQTRTPTPTPLDALPKRAGVGVGDEDGRLAWRGLALVLTAVFLTKFNYWVLVVLALAVSEFSYAPVSCVQTALAWVRGFDWTGWLRAQLRHPLTYLLAGLLVLFTAVASGVNLSSRHVSMHSPHNVVHIAFIVLCIRLAQSWWRQREFWQKDVSPPVRQLLFFHVVPLACWFLLPKRLGYWLFYMDPNINGGEFPDHSVVRGVTKYWNGLVTDYHLGLWSLLIALALAAIALLHWSRLERGGRAVLFLVIIAFCLAVHHPNKKSRFLHSWVAAGWVTAGAGLACLLYGRLGQRAQSLRPWLATAALGGIALAHAHGFVQEGHYPEGRLDGSTRDLSDYYLPFVEQSQQATFLATIEMKHLARWSVLERRCRLDNFDVNIKGYGFTPEDNRRSFDAWLQKTPSDTVIFVDIPTGTYFYQPTGYNESYGRLRDYLAEQTVFRRAEEHYFPEYGCTVSIWKR